MERDQLASRDEWQALLADYVRNALSERLQSQDSPQFNRRACRDEAVLRGQRGKGAVDTAHTAECPSTLTCGRSCRSLLYILDDFASPEKRAQVKARLWPLICVQATASPSLVADWLLAAGHCGGGGPPRVFD